MSTIRSIKHTLIAIANDLLGEKIDGSRFDLSYSPDPSFGDLSTNLALVFAKLGHQAPREFAERVADRLRNELKEARVIEVAGPGFINITLMDSVVAELAQSALSLNPSKYEGQEVVIEYSDPNPFKVLHVGHLYTSVVGDAVSNLVRAAGGRIHAVNFGGDVGLHVGKTLWAMIKELGGELPAKLAEIDGAERPLWMARCYVAGEQAYGSIDAAKQEIIDLNKRVYEIHAEKDHESSLAKIYWTCRQWSYDYFDEFYKRIGTHFEKYYPESVTAPIGLAKVREELAKGVYTHSDGAVVFKGEDYGLHTRVFITSNGLPTYEAKDVGLIMSKWRDYHFDKSIVITGNDITEYMKVVLKSVEQFAPELAQRSMHLTHGNVKLAGGVKMSSRRGNFLQAADVIDLVAGASRKINPRTTETVVLGAIKYAFLKQRIGADLVFVPEESVSLDGNSGPYLQYAHARARSILSKAGELGTSELGGLEAGERSLAWEISKYPQVVERAVEELMPHYVATYLYDLAQAFNRFYEVNRVLGDSRQDVRLRLVALYAEVLSHGLELLGLEAPARL